jgi:hypothetical protein
MRLYGVRVGLLLNLFSNCRRPKKLFVAEEGVFERFRFLDFLSERCQYF